MIARPAHPVLLMALACVAGCGNGRATDADVVARAYTEFLSRNELRQVIPMDASAEDSAAMATLYIENWMRDRVLMAHAEMNLSAAQKDVEAELLAYRRSLILHAYEQALIDQKLDTIVTTAQVEEYFAANEKNFVLKEDIVRVRWFKVREDDRKTLKRLEDLWGSDDASKLRELEIWLAQRGISIFDSGEEWVDFEDLQRDVPLNTDNATDLLDRTDRVVVKDSVNTYFVDLLEHRLRTGTAPVQRVATEIKAIIINQRKLRLLETMRNDLYNNAFANKDVERLH
ncbi:MAG: hypothetical protein IPI55_02555 [Flavobacteriales bacterium]|nr:hypothetical protein [Flavobacteriales bacterium]